jgi:hypothetical protein
MDRAAFPETMAVGMDFSTRAIGLVTISSVVPGSRARGDHRFLNTYARQQGSEYCIPRWRHDGIAGSQAKTEIAALRHSRPNGSLYRPKVNERS